MNYKYYVTVIYIYIYDFSLNNRISRMYIVRYNDYLIRYPKYTKAVQNTKNKNEITGSTIWPEAVAC